MRNWVSLSLLVVSSLLFVSCRQEAAKPWIPVLEQSGFSYLQDAVSEAQRDVTEATGQLHSGDTDQAVETMQKANHALLKLELYFLPMTEVRQLIYDADRLYYLKRSEETAKKLQQAQALLEQISATGGESVTKALGEIIEMIDNLQRTMKMNPIIVPEKFRLLGEKIDLAVLKGDLILAGAKFTEEN